MSIKKLNIGLRQARRLCQMPQEERLAFIAEGLPMILASAQGFWRASLNLRDAPREAEVLKGFAQEEAAKILILLDVVRCPPHLLGSKLGVILGWFYDHLARLIYVDAVSWKPTHTAQLREYVQPHRKAHYLEGQVGEYIVPNWNVYHRESKLYADIEAYEDGKPRWSIPNGYTHIFPSFVPRALALVEAMAALGMFTTQGLKAIAEIWRHVEFKDTEDHNDAERLTCQLLERLNAEGLPTETATQKHVDSLFDDWQLPMYDFDLSLINVSLEELKAEQERLYWAEAGDP
jgi:hypothetical protein